MSEPCTTWSLVRYFLYLGSLGFGGPVIGSLFILCGVVVLLIQAPPRRLLAWVGSGKTLPALAWPLLLTTGAVGVWSKADSLTEFENFNCEGES